MSSGPWRITFDTNPDECNLHCVMCEEHSQFSPQQKKRLALHQPPRRMKMELVKQVLEGARSSGLREIIPSTMGEPLLFKHFEELIDLCRLHGVMLNVTTNGTFPRLGATEWARRLVPVTSDIKISWNGATASTYERVMVGGNFEQAVQNVRDFVAVRDAHAVAGGNRCRVTFQLTFLESNFTELADMVSLAGSLGVDRVKGHHLWAHFDEIRGESMRRSPEAIERWNGAVRDAVDTATRLGILLENIGPLESTAVRDIDPAAACPFLGQEAWVATDGRFNPCCAPDAQRQTLGYFGNLHELSLEEIWNSRSYQELRQSYRAHPLCVSCNMRRAM